MWERILWKKYFWVSKAQRDLIAKAIGLQRFDGERWVNI